MLHFEQTDIVSIRPLSDFDQTLKRLSDILGATTAIIVCLPVLLTIGFLIAITSPGPILFRQRRVGLNNRIFAIFKFRSMYVHLTDAHASEQTQRDDARITPLGKCLRKTSLDELPQLFNVILGDMALVGPRPHALATTVNGKALDEIVPSYGCRHQVKPGITGLAQVNGYRGVLDTQDKLKQRIQYDLCYIENWSLWLDVKILLKTVFLVLFDRNAF